MGYEKEPIYNNPFKYTGNGILSWNKYKDNEQYIIKFSDDICVSIVRGIYTYGFPDKWESIVINKSQIVSVLGFLSEEDVLEILNQVEDALENNIKHFSFKDYIIGLGKKHEDNI